MNVPRPDDRVWVVRDLDEKTLAPARWVSVWIERPRNWRIGAGQVWLSESVDEPYRGWIGSLWIPEAWRILGSIPDDERQVIVMERDRDAVREKIAAVEASRVQR